MIDKKLHYVVVTGIIVKDGKYLITKRSPKEKAFPGLWTVPGGKLKQSDYSSLPKDTADHWYNVLENLLEREIEEEVGLKVKNIRYLLSLSFIRADDIPTIIISLYCDYGSGEVKLSEESVDYAWITAVELDKYKFVPGLREEIELVDKILKKGKKDTWKGKYNNTSDKSLRDGIA
ncbi:MAG: NUDIX domain-containing protein [Candidatus Nealsonbacteria bacterium]|nr:MAG: NUDIX domain-containing protein [Candidatus Nealsonbacteria bacterium]